MCLFNLAVTRNSPTPVHGMLHNVVLDLRKAVVPLSVVRSRNKAVRNAVRLILYTHISLFDSSFTLSEVYC